MVCDLKNLLVLTQGDKHTRMTMTTMTTTTTTTTTNARKVVSTREEQ